MKEVADYSAALSSNPKTYPSASGVNVVVTPVSGTNIAAGIAASGIFNAAIAADTGKIQLGGDIPDRQVSGEIKRLARGD